MKKMKKNDIVLIGAGAIGTALGNAMAKNDWNDVTLISIEEDVVESINSGHINRKYFPGIILHPGLKATQDTDILKRAEYIFMAIPSVETVKYLEKNHDLVPANAIIINLAKGFGEHNCTIIRCLQEILPNRICPMKGPTFARDIINNQPTAFTIGSENPELFAEFKRIFSNTNIYLDFSTDVLGVEILSILKNIYAIVAGITDASFDAPNLRSLVLTKAFREMRAILVEFGGQEQTMFTYSGFGDFTLTALNDLSRNRTLGLLIGKGFFTREMSDKVVLEGKIAVNVLADVLANRGLSEKFPILMELHKVFTTHYDLSQFVDRIIKFNGE
ncbi:MAG: 2-dehydropantoate 2-reductase N-terminal domain-containing protein [Bacteroidales bacterium]|jgi:glycerol-3-phosphate dehydrogenase (NAD(P)+)|nr:2-dehydropantoate 2-reductase N-terminal domain-containing protein [Bacteroidales bacterium]